MSKVFSSNLKALVSVLQPGKKKKIAEYETMSFTGSLSLISLFDDINGFSQWFEAHELRDNQYTYRIRGIKLL